MDGFATCTGNGCQRDRLHWTDSGPASHGLYKMTGLISVLMTLSICFWRHRYYAFIITCHESGPVAVSAVPPHQVYCSHLCRASCPRILPCVQIDQNQRPCMMKPCGPRAELPVTVVHDQGIHRGRGGARHRQWQSQRTMHSPCPSLVAAAEPAPTDPPPVRHPQPLPYPVRYPPPCMPPWHACVLLLDRRSHVYCIPVVVRSDAGDMTSLRSCLIA